MTLSRSMAFVLAVGGLLTSNPPTLPRHPACAPKSASAATEDGSVYDLDVPLADSEGRATTLGALRGQVLVASMIYTSCVSVCPLVTEDMKKIERQLPARDANRVSFVLFSLDPGRDTPEALRTFAATHALDRRWQLFAASADAVRTLAVALGVQYRQEESGEISHSATIVVVDRRGGVAYRQVGVSAGPGRLISAVDAAVAEPRE